MLLGLSLRAHGALLALKGTAAHVVRREHVDL